MLAFILVLYCCILCKACYIVRNKRWPRATLKRKKREMAKGQEKKTKEMKGRKRGRRPEKNNMKAQSAYVCQRYKIEKKK